jgi:hypothetical protein
MIDALSKVHIVVHENVVNSYEKLSESIEKLQILTRKVLIYNNLLFLFIMFNLITLDKS